jgi:5'-phosphate synthase pdxT subunit
VNARATIGVLALQGAFDAHVQHLNALDTDVRLVKTETDLQEVNGLVIPGGESTTMSNLLVASGLGKTLIEKIDDGFPVFGTCAGMIMMAHSIIDGRPDQIVLNAMDIQVRRNGYGRQNDSFEQDIDIKSFDTPFHALFIRAPIIEEVGDDVEVFSTVNGHPVLVRQGTALASSFHPELVPDLRVHEIFISIVHESNSSQVR